MNSVTDIIGSVVIGSLDEHLDELEEAIRDRRKKVAGKLAFSFAPGDKVTIDTHGLAGCNYLQGLTAKIDKVNRTTATLSFEGENKIKARRYGHGVRMPLTNIRLVEA